MFTSAYSYGLSTVNLALAESDCETVGDGWLAQPVNAITSLSFSVVGVGILVWARTAQGVERRTRVALGILMIATGIGSFLYHGPQPAGSQLAHDLTFLAVLALLAGSDARAGIGWPEWTQWTVAGLFTVCAAIVTTVLSDSTNVFTAIAVVGLVISHVIIRRSGPINSKAFYGSLAALGLAIASFVVGRSGAPLCEPGSAIQGHGMWHIGAAVALGLYVVATAPARESGHAQ